MSRVPAFVIARGAAVVVALVLLLVGAGPHTAHADEPEKRATAIYADVRPVVDGRLDDAIWAKATAFDAFVERRPALRERPAEHTAFKLVADADALYIGIACDDTHPSEVRGRTTQRDSMALFDDDAVSVKIDPLRDGRTTYGFGVNAAGGRIDYRGLDEMTWQVEFDTTWDGAVARGDAGWTVELRVPWSSLGLDAAALPEVIGFDVSRDHSRLQATYDWALITPPHQPIAASQYGVVAGLRELLAGRAAKETHTSWAVTPWVLGGYRDEGDGDGIKGVVDAGLDFEVDLGRGFDATVTLNTDFAQVEVDDVVTNLDRFDIFLPEKRDFFLKDGDLFGFGEVGWASLFHSRTIGLAEADDGTVEVPIVAGVKVAGRTPGGFRMGALSVLTRPAAELPWRMDSVLRLQQTFGKGSAVGLMSTYRQSAEDAVDHNLTIGADGTFSLASDPLTVRTFFATSIDSAAATETSAKQSDVDIAAAIDARWRGEAFRSRLGYAYFGPAFQADLGYFERTGVQHVFGNVQWAPRIEAASIETLWFMFEQELVLRAPDGHLLEWTPELDAEINWDSGAWAGLYSYFGEVETEAFTVGDDHAIAAGTYDQTRVELSGGTASTEALSGELSLVYRAYYGGTNLSAGASIVAKPGTWLRATLAGEAHYITLPSGDFWAPTVNLRLGSGLTKDLELTAFAGWSGLDHRVSLQTRLRWSLGSGSDLFAVWELALDDASGAVALHSLVAKLALRLP